MTSPQGTEQPITNAQDLECETHGLAIKSTVDVNSCCMQQCRHNYYVLGGNILPLGPIAENIEGSLI